MSFKQGCFKPALIGCLGLLGIGVLLAVITAFIAWRGIDEQRIEEPELAPLAASSLGELTDAPGRVILDLRQGEFEIRPARAGEGITVRARYDREVFELSHDYETLPDSSWIYRVQFRRTMPALQAIFRALMGGDTDAYVHVHLPADIPIELEVHVAEGELEAEIGGLWITEGDIRFEKGGFSLDVDEPLRQPMNRLSIRCRMGGFEASRLGNTSPRLLDIDCKMGGADIDLGGFWVRDCDIQIAVRMGGMGVGVPDDVEVQGLGAAGSGLRHENAEIPSPVLRFSVSESMGEIEVYRR